jgi:hypothetical protein
MKTLSIICLITFSISSVFSQDNASRERLKEKMKAQSAAYITQKLELTEAEAQKFWPIYNSYREELEKERSTVLTKPSNDLNEKEAEKFIESLLESKTREIEIQKKYVQKFKTVIPAKKIVKLYNAEREFKENVISNIRERRQDRLGRRRN